MKPLNGENTHPLSAHAVAELRNLQDAPVPRCSMNPGVVNRLLRDDLADIVMVPSPFKTHKFKLIAHMRITAAGRRELLTR